MNIKGLRKEYQNQVLHRSMLATDPFDQFECWFQDACHADIPEPNAMTVATVGADGQPTVRTVLLKMYDREGFVFFTNYGSRKARQIEGNHHVALLFPWVNMARQVAVTGIAEKVSLSESAKYFASRPRESQIGAWISRQSSVLGSRQILMMELAKMKQKFKQGEIPLPDFWGGFRVRPQTIEFWQGQTARLHDRFLYTRQADGSWQLDRLAP